MNIIPKKSRSVVLQADFLNGLEVIRVCKKSHHFKDVRNRKKKKSLKSNYGYSFRTSNAVRSCYLFIFVRLKVCLDENKFIICV